MRFSSSLSLFPGNKGFMSKNSPKMQPTDHASIGVEYSLMPRRSSGARYHRVTTTAVYAFRGEPYSLAKPKSPTCKISEKYDHKFLKQKN